MANVIPWPRAFQVQPMPRRMVLEVSPYHSHSPDGATVIVWKNEYRDSGHFEGEFASVAEAMAYARQYQRDMLKQYEVV